ncbi:MAG: SDR family NAD(P)-dependent oxidoreductase, partial [Chthoniobacteraceae bacterium]
MFKTLTGKVALVTGGSRGIGAAIAQRLAADGAFVVLTYAKSPEKAQEVQKAIEASGGTALAIQADSADASAVQGAIAKAVETYGRLDVLVNNAGVGVAGPIDQFSLEDFDRLMAVNVRAVFVAIQAALPHMGEGGRVITIGSCLASRVPFGGISAYAATKAAVTCLTQALSRELGPR